MKTKKLAFIFPLIGCLLGGCNPSVHEHQYIPHNKEVFDEEVGHDFYYTCNGCNKLFDQNRNEITEIPTLPANLKIILPNKLNGKKISTLDPIVEDYLKLTDEDAIASYLISHSSDKNCKTGNVKIDFENNGASFTYKIEVSTDSNFNNIVYSKKIYDSPHAISNLPKGMYYYRIMDNKNSEYVSKVDSFEITNAVRTIDCNINMRDIGGWPTLTGDKLKYGYLYRCALPSSTQLSTFKSLNIKTELDLRIKQGSSKDEIGSFEGIGMNDGINYVRGLDTGVQYWPQYDQIFKSVYATVNSNYFKKVFDLLSDESNYPIAFHCASGADRTGTLAYIINGLSGVSYDNLCKDFELTSFFKSPRYRSEIVDYKFTDSGAYNNSGTAINFGLMHKTMMETYGTGGKTLQQAIYNFLVSYCGVESSKIKSALDIILEGNSYLNLFN